jgi:hypothetical protein
VADAPELVLRRSLATLLNTWTLAVYAPTGALPARGVKLDGVMPTTVDDFTMLSSPPTTFEGRANALYRVQFYTRRKGTPLTVEQWANDLNGHLDHKEYRPAVLGISWAAETSRLYFDPDSQGRSAVAVNYTFRGRRQ